MKALFLVEGENDGIFLQEIISRAGNKRVKPYFYRNDGTKMEKRDQETKLLRQFRRKEDPHNVFVKEEGGHDFVVRLFTNLVVNFLMQSYNLSLTLLFDHDGRDPYQEIQKINNDVKGKTSGKIRFEATPPEKRILNGFYRRDFSLIKQSGGVDRPVNHFSFASFDTSLETVASGYSSKPEQELAAEDIRSLAFRVDLRELLHKDTDIHI